MRPPFPPDARPREILEERAADHMKILIQNSVFYPNVIGGAEVSSHLLGRELRRRGVAVDAVASTGRCGSGTELSVRPTDDGLGTVYEAPAHGLCDLLPVDGASGRPGLVKRSANHLTSVTSGRWARLFDEALARSRPDIVHTNTIVGLTPAIWRVAHRRGIPVVHTLRDYHLLCPRTTLLRSSHTDCIDKPLPCRVLASLKLRQTHEVTLVTAPSRHVLRKHLEAGGFRAARAEVVPNALEEWPEALPPRPRGGPVRGLFMGQINHHKGIGLLLESLAGLLDDPTFASLEFALAGQGPLAAEVDAFCAAYPDRVRYHGMVRGDARGDLLRQADFMVVPSIWAEPFSRSIIDGFSWGLPVIGCAMGGIPEVITHDRDGLLVDPTAAALREAIGALVVDEAMRRRLGEAARERAADFTLERQVDRFLELYRDVLAAGSAAGAGS